MRVSKEKAAENRERISKPRRSLFASAAYQGPVWTP